MDGIKRCGCGVMETNFNGLKVSSNPKIWVLKFFMNCVLCGFVSEDNILCVIPSASRVSNSSLVVSWTCPLGVLILRKALECVLRVVMLMVVSTTSHNCLLVVGPRRIHLLPNHAECIFRWSLSGALWSYFGVAAANVLYGCLFLCSVTRLWVVSSFDVWAVWWVCWKSYFSREVVEGLGSVLGWFHMMQMRAVGKACLFDNGIVMVAVICYY